MAFVILRAGSVEKWKDHNAFAKGLKIFARESLPGFAIPEWVKVVPELPVSRPALQAPARGSESLAEDIHWKNSQACVAQRSG